MGRLDGSKNKAGGGGGLKCIDKKGKKSNTFRVKLLFLPSLFLALAGQWHVHRMLDGGIQYLDVKNSHARTCEQEKMKVDRKTAVVFSARYLTNCSAARLHHLVTTTPPEIDVWFLHDHAKYSSNSSQVATSLRHLQYLTQSLRLQHAAKENGLIRGFDTPQSGVAKSSFLRWMIKQGDQYRYAWHVEEDVFYTGLWSDVFRAHECDTADLVAHRLPFGKTWTHAQNERCRIKYPSEMFQHTNFTPMECMTLIRHAHHWAILRVSHSFATHLLKDLESGSLYGHHEAVVGILLQVKPYNLTYSKLQHVGKIIAPPSKNWTLATFANPVLPQRLYHPIKCEVNQTDLTPLLQQMVHRVN